MKITVIFAMLLVASTWALSQSATSNDLRDLSARLNAVRSSGAFVKVDGIDISEALRIEADAILAIDSRLRRLEENGAHGDCNVVGDHNANCNK